MLAVTVCGSLDPELELGSLIVFDDLHFLANRLGDGALCTLYDEPGMKGRGHWIFERPFSDGLRAALLAGAREAARPVRDGGCYGHVDGPRFNTRTEIRMLQACGVTAVSQTAGPETVLCGEAELPYALIGYATDYANGVATEPTPVQEFVRPHRREHGDLRALRSPPRCATCAGAARAGRRALPLRLSRPAVLVMARAPRPGEAKTRLEPLLGREGCARLQAALIARAVAWAGEVGCEPWVACTPGDARDELAACAPGAAGFAQEGGIWASAWPAQRARVFARQRTDRCSAWEPTCRPCRRRHARAALDDLARAAMRRSVPPPTAATTWSRCASPTPSSSPCRRRGGGTAGVRADDRGRAPGGLELGMLRLEVASARRQTPAGCCSTPRCRKRWRQSCEAGDEGARARATRLHRRPDPRRGRRAAPVSSTTYARSPGTGRS